VQKHADTVSGVSLNPGESIPYRALTNTFEKIEATTKRLEINSYCSEFFLEVLRVCPEELPKVTYLFINRLGPDYEGLELGLGESLIMKALSEATGRSIAQIKADYHKAGDLGLVAVKSKHNQGTMFAPKPLSVSEVFKLLTEIAKSSGHSSQSKKIAIIKRMLIAAQGSEAKFLVRSLEGKLRIGMAEKSVLTALAQAFVAWTCERNFKTPNADEITKGEELIKDVYCQMPNYEVIINSMIEHGIDKLAETCKLKAGIPLKPMLAKPTKSITEVLDRFSGEKFTCEYKYDGERAQVHGAEDGKIFVYSRNMEDMSQRYPDIVSIVPNFIVGERKPFILDCEAVAWDREQRKILPFQVLSTRKRKDVEEGSIKVRVLLFAFDILYYDGEVLLQRSLADRRKVIQEHFREVEGEFAYAKSMDTDSTEEIQHFLDQSIKDSCEGLMVKVLEGPESGYEPSKRSRNWLKLKKDYLSGVGDSLDLVVLGGYFGRGKRTNVYGGFLLGCYNADTEEYETVCKIGTGFSEQNLEDFHKQLSETVVSEPKSYVSYDQTPNSLPDVWFEPSVVWEILTADLSLSPVYKAGIQELGRGVSLRFPRFIKIREDKKPEDATTSEQIVQFYKRQVSANG
jgi:DNA ligase-1